MIGDRIKAARKRRRMNQSELADLIGVKPHTISGWESGKVRNMYPENLLNTGRALDVSLEWLVFERGEMGSYQYMQPTARVNRYLVNDAAESDHLGLLNGIITTARSRLKPDQWLVVENFISSLPRLWEQKSYPKT